MFGWVPPPIVDDGPVLRYVKPARYPLAGVGALFVIAVERFDVAEAVGGAVHKCRWAGQSAIFEQTTNQLVKLGLPTVVA